MSMTILTMLMNMVLKFQVIKLILVLLLKEAEMLQKKMSGGVQFLMKKNKIDVIMGTGKILPEKQIEVTDSSNKKIPTSQNILLLQQEQDQDNYPIYHKMENKL